MEENQNQNPGQNASGKKKTMGPVKGLIVALILAILVIAVGLLIRMLIADDGDYFKPIKSIFGLEEEKDDEKTETSKTTSSSTKVDTTTNSSGRYALLSDDVEDEDVKHYRLTIDISKVLKKAMKEASTLKDMNSKDDDFEWDYDLDDSDYSYPSSSDSYLDSFGNYMSMAMMYYEQLSDLIGGEMYFDIYFEGNEIVQIVCGYDYAEFAENLYDYLAEEAEDEMEEEGIENANDLMEFFVDKIEEYLDEDKIYDMIMKDADTEALKSFGIKEKDFKDAIDFVCNPGIFEIYINGTTKLKAIISMLLDSDEFKEELESSELNIDEDNVIESFIKEMNKTEGISEYGMKFVEVR